jgi:hypothetical protein
VLRVRGADAARFSASYRAVDCVPIAITRAVSRRKPNRASAGHITIKCSKVVLGVRRGKSAALVDQ